MGKIRLGVLIAIVLALSLFYGLSWAAQATAQASISATVPSVTSIGLNRDDNSVGRGSATTIVFDRRDDQDMTDGTGNAGFMYAPYRSEAGKNWHVAEIAANGATMTLSATVSGTIGQTQLSSIMKLFSGGFFRAGENTPITGTPSIDWEFANGWQRQLNQPFTGTVPFNYQLNISGIPAGGPFTGTITFTLVTT